MVSALFYGAVIYHGFTLHSSTQQGQPVYMPILIINICLLFFVKRRMNIRNHKPNNHKKINCSHNSRQFNYVFQDERIVYC